MKKIKIACLIATSLFVTPVIAKVCQEKLIIVDGNIVNLSPEYTYTGAPIPKSLNTVVPFSGGSYNWHNHTMSNDGRVSCVYDNSKVALEITTKNGNQNKPKMRRSENYWEPIFYQTDMLALGQ